MIFFSDHTAGRLIIKKLFPFFLCLLPAERTRGFLPHQGGSRLGAGPGCRPQRERAYLIAQASSDGNQASPHERNEPILAAGAPDYE